VDGSRRQFLGLTGAAGLGAGVATVFEKPWDKGGSGSTPTPAPISAVFASGSSAGSEQGHIFVVPWSGDASTNVRAINDAIEAAAKARGRSGGSLPGGGLVQLPDGVFKLDGPVLMRAGVLLAGTGLGTVLQRTKDDGRPMVTFADGSPVGAAGIRDMYITGLKGRHGQSGNDGVVIPANASGFRGNVVLTNLLVTQHAGNGVVSKQIGCRLEGVVVQHSGGDGIVIDGSDSFVHLCQVSNSNAGYRIEGGNAHLSSCYAYYNDQSGFALNTSRAVIVACAAQDNEPDGFVFRTTGSTVSGCLADTNKVTNFHVTAASDSAFTGLSSVFRPRGRYAAAPTGGGIFLEGNPQRVLISGVSPASAGGVVGAVAAGSISQIVS
jgi:hypothetical protein